MRALTAPLALSLMAASLLATPVSAAQPQPTARQQDRMDKLLAGRTAGKPVPCLPGTFRNLQSEQAGPNTIIYYQNTRRDRTVWRNDPPGPGCFAGGRDLAFATRRPVSQTCRGDIIQTFDPLTRIPYGSCALGDFVPYTKPR